LIPKIRNLKPFSFPSFTTFKLDNDIVVYEMSQSNFEVIKLELVFEAGRVFEDHKTVARATAALLREGTLNLSSEALNEQIDFYGATIMVEASMDYASLKLYCLRKYLPKMLELLSEILFEPRFDQNELNIFKNRAVEKLSYELNKNDVIAYRKITELVFGAKHPYGYNSQLSDYQELEIAFLKKHYTDHIRFRKCHIFISGKVDLDCRTLLNNTFGNFELEEKEAPAYQSSIGAVENCTIKSNNKEQQSLRLSKKMFNRTHQDFPKSYFLTTVLGGYFGSRLMKNIREEKGLTYNIYATLEQFKNDGYLMISAEIAKDTSELVIEEIFKEFDYLKTRPIEDEELVMVKNYLLGSLLSMIDGPISAIDVLRNFELSSAGVHHFDDLVDQIHSMDSGTLIATANSYLASEEFVRVLVG